MPPEQVEVGDHRLGGDVVGVRRRSRTGGVEVDTLGALEHLGHRQAGHGLGVGRVGGDQLLVLRDRTVDVTLAEGVLGRCVARVEALVALVASASTGARSAAGGGR